MDEILLILIGNTINLMNLTTSISQALPFQNRPYIARLCLSPDRHTLISIDTDGFSLIINLTQKVVVAHLTSKTL